MRRLSPQFDTPLYGATRCENEFARKFAAMLEIENYSESAVSVRQKTAPYLRDKKKDAAFFCGQRAFRSVTVPPRNLEINYIPAGAEKSQSRSSMLVWRRIAC